MQAFSGYDKAKKNAEYKGSAQIPTGAYVCQIEGVKYEKSENGNSDSIAIRFDVYEGEFKGFFKKQYEENASDDKKWKGATRIYVPKDDGTEQDGWTKNSFARWINSFESSNTGYMWDWDEDKLKGKLIGLVFGPTGTVIDGKEITYNEVHGSCTVAEVRANTFYKKYLELKKKNGFTGSNTSKAQQDDNPIFNVAKDEDIPF